MKKLIVGFLLLCLTVTNAVMEQQEVSAATETNWKKMYMEVLQEAQKNYPEEDFYKCKYELAHFNNDKIPELVVISNQIRRTYMYTIKGSKTDEFLLTLGEEVSFASKRNMILIQDKNHYTGYDFVFKIKDGKFVKTWDGSYDDAFSKNIKLCKINGKSVSAFTYKKIVKEYEKKCDSSVDNAKKYSWEEILKKFENSKEESAKTKVYGIRGASIEKFLLKNGELSIQLDSDGFLGDKYKDLTTKNMVYKVDKNCQWRELSLGEDSNKTSYKEIKGMIKSAREDCFELYIFVHVKGNRIVKVEMDHA